MNTTDYLREGYRQLSDTKFYTKLQYDPTENIVNNVRKTLTQMKQKGLISEKNFEHLDPENYSEARFYMLLKVHKNRCTRQTNLQFSKSPHEQNQQTCGWTYERLCSQNQIIH